MARLRYPPIGRDRPIPIPEEDTQPIAEARVNGGMITMVDPADIPNNAFQLVRNAKVRFDRTTRRPGTSLMLPVKPNSLPVLKLATIKLSNGLSYTIRITDSTLHLRESTTWTPFSGMFTGGITDRFTAAVVRDKLAIANNGADFIQIVNFDTQDFEHLGNSRKMRYITGFANRLWGFAERNVDETLINWSAEGDIHEFDPLVNESAGFDSLYTSASDTGDHIKGGFGFSNVMVVLREKSIVLGTRSQIPQNPVNFVTAVPGVGCDSPFSAQIVGIGQLAWMDRRTGTVYAYSPGSAPEPIGRPVEKSIISNIDDPETIFSGYNPLTNEYSIFIPPVGSNYVRAWTYSFRDKTWVQEEYYGLTCSEDTELATAGTTIDQLEGTIEDLVGNIDELSPSSSTITTRAYGRNDGTIVTEDENVDHDAVHADFPQGVPFDTVFVSKVFTIPKDDIYVAKIVIEYTATRGGTFKLQYALDGGVNEESWRTAKIVRPDTLGKPALLVHRRNIRARRIAWRLTTDAGNFDILSYEVHVLKSGDSRK